MQNDWNDYFAFSKNISLIKLHCSEDCVYRNIISRCYYSSFHHMQLLLYGGSLSKLDNGNIHERVQEDLRKKVSSANHNLYDEYCRLRKRRTSCDYHFNYKGNLNKDSKDALLVTEKILKTVSI